jgi:hypothetical protein
VKGPELAVAGEAPLIDTGPRVVNEPVHEDMVGAKVNGP